MLPEVPSFNKLYSGRRKVSCDAFSKDLLGLSFDFIFLHVNGNFAISAKKPKKRF